MYNHFHCMVCVTSSNLQRIMLNFRIRLHAADVHLQRNSELLLSGVRDARITNKHLKAVSSVGEHSPRDIGITFADVQFVPCQ